MNVATALLHRDPPALLYRDPPAPLHRDPRPPPGRLPAMNAVWAGRDRYHTLRVKRVVPETTESTSIVFDVPHDLTDEFSYEPGQFVTLRLVIDGDRLVRSYSMSSAPSVDADLQVTVKRIPDGVVSNWINDHVADGDTIDVSAPGGAFVLTHSDDDIVAFAAGSGITPIFSIIKAALHTTRRRVRLLFANHDRSSAIFADALDQLRDRFPERFEVEHHEDAAEGFLTAPDVVAFAGGRQEADVYLCGPGGFMDVVETALLNAGIDQHRIHLERFTPERSGGDSALTTDEITTEARVTITVGRRTETVTPRPGATILEAAKWCGLPAPSTCEAGHCASCMAQVLEGRVEMSVNDVLTPDEVAEGWVLTCQAVPVSDAVRVVYPD